MFRSGKKCDIQIHLANERKNKPVNSWKPAFRETNTVTVHCVAWLKIIIHGCNSVGLFVDVTKACGGDSESRGKGRVGMWGRSGERSVIELGPPLSP